MRSAEMVPSSGNLVLTASLLLLTLMTSFSSVVKPQTEPSEPYPRVKIVNLGGWLVLEGWITPYLYDTIPNNDMLDGVRFNLKSVATGKFLAAEMGGGTIIVANRDDKDDDWAKFTLWRVNETAFQLRVDNRRFMGLDKYPEVGLIANATEPGETETFQIIRHVKDKMRVRIRASNGHFLQVKSFRLVTADHSAETEWQDDDPSVFLMNIFSVTKGEYQLLNGIGDRTRAQKVMQEHYDTFITEKDFEWMKDNGLDGVKVTVGWWIAYDPNPPKPFVNGSLATLDQGFKWAEKYGIKMIIQLHGAKGSQNGWLHSGCRDGTQEWGTTNHSLQETLAVIDFLAGRYAKSPRFYGVELLNEPIGPIVSLEMLGKYYREGYFVVRNHSSTAYVICSLRLAYPYVSTELFPYLEDLNRTVVDVHMYSLFWDVFDNMTVQQNIDFVTNDRIRHLFGLRTTSSQWPLFFVGEWCLDWEIENATKEDTRRFAEAQLQVYERATFGWAFWTLKSFGKEPHDKYWNLQKMVDEGYMSLKKD